MNLQIARLVSVFILSLGITLHTSGTRADVRDEIFEIFDSIHEGMIPREIPEGLSAIEALDLLYSGRNYQPAWSSYEEILPVLAALEASYLDGLNPDDYHYSALKALEADYFQSREQNTRDRLRAAFDILLSDGVMLLASHLEDGKVDPSRIEQTWNYTSSPLTPAEIAAAVQAAIDAEEVVQRLDAFRPPLRVYRLLKEELAHYRELAARHEFSQLPSDVVLRPGMQHPNVTRLRAQLEQRGYEVAGAPEPALYDGALVAAVKDFQRLHTLDVDGIVGRGTFRELNTSYSDRVEQIRLNLDRVRWVGSDLTAQMVIVNIAGFELYYFEDQALSWESGVMVGKIRHQTPIFRKNMTYLEFNPTWTVPRGILRRSLYPKFSADPNYVSENNYVLYDSHGAAIDPLSLDWSQYSRNRFPFRVVQQPGPNNALGQVKFMFPNQYAIYVHDTPARSLFSRTSRAFSSGCIRVRDPMMLAELLLKNEDGWDRAKIDATVEGGERTVVRLGRPVNVILMYWTASPTTDGRIQLHPDLYGKDPASLALLNEPTARPVG